MRKESLQSVLARFPQDELNIRRRFARDEHFRSICTDYEEACTALRHWRDAGEQGRNKSIYYESFVDELETELLAVLGVSTTCR